MISGLISAITLLTRIPLKWKGSYNFSASLYWFPFVGILLASVLSVVVLLASEFTNLFWNELTAFIIILFGTVLTGALHLDGFADWADSLGAIPNKEKMLTIMKDSNSGAFGVVAIVLLILFKWILLVKLLSLNLAIIGLFTAFISSRFAMVYFSVSLSYARKEGGTGELIIKGAKPKHTVVAFVESLMFLFIIGGISSIIIFLFSFLIILIWKRWCKKYFNGITGDLLGAGSELVETFTFLLIALFYNAINLHLNQIIQKL